MMRRSTIAVPLVVVLGACKLDAFMFEPKAVEAYELSAAVIPDSLQKIVTFSSDDETLYGVYAQQPGNAARRTVLYSHGNNDNLPYFWERVELLWRAGFDVFIYDYRGFGMSSGSSKNEGTFFADARAALNYVLSQPGVTPRSLVVYGYSLGGTAAIELASNTVTPLALITESTFLSGEALVRSGTLLRIPSGYLLHGKFDNIGKAPRVTAPWLVLHGTEDIRVDVGAARALYAAAGGPKRLTIVSGADHGTVPFTMGAPAYIALVRAFVENPLAR